MIIVTGATGLVGTHVLLDLVQKQEKVRALYRSEASRGRCLKQLKEFGLAVQSSNQYIDWIETDIQNPESVYQAMIGGSKIIHCAALVSFKSNEQIPLYKTNVEGTRNVVNAAIDLGIHELVHISSTAAIGSSKPGEVKTENHKWRKEEKGSFYGVTKHLAELEVYRGLEEGLSILILNPGIIIGPGKWNEGSAELFSKVAKGLKFFTLGTNGYVDVRDVARAATELPVKAHESNRFILVGENLSYQKIFELIADSIGCKIPSIQVKPWMVELAWRLEKLRSVLLFRSPLVTKETARTSMKKVEYSHEKISTTYNFQFTPIKEAIVRTGQLFKKEFA